MPTPQAYSAGDSGSRPGITPLDIAVRPELECHAARAKERRSGLVPTPTAGDSKRGDCPSERARRSPSLVSAVHERVPTPTARDWRSGCASDETHARNARPLSEHVGGLLNPDWVEWLMGWPIGWTRLDGTPAPLLGPDQWDEEPAIPRTVASQAHRVDRLRCLGNGQVPQCASMAVQLLAKNAQPPTK